MALSLKRHGILIISGQPLHFPPYIEQNLFNVIHKWTNVELSRLLTAFLDGLVTPVGTVSGLVAHFAHLDTLPAATLELLRPVALSHCGDNQTI